MESTYTRMMHFLLQDVKSLHCLISDNAKKNNNVIIFYPYPQEKIDLNLWHQKITSCQKN